MEEWPTMLSPLSYSSCGSVFKLAAMRGAAATSLVGMECVCGAAQSGQDGEEGGSPWGPAEVAALAHASILAVAAGREGLLVRCPTFHHSHCLFNKIISGGDLIKSLWLLLAAGKAVSEGCVFCFVSFCFVSFQLLRRVFIGSGSRDLFRVTPLGVAAGLRVGVGNVFGPILGGHSGG